MENSFVNNVDFLKMDQARDQDETKSKNQNQNQNQNQKKSPNKEQTTPRKPSNNAESCNQDFWNAIWERKIWVAVLIPLVGFFLLILTTVSDVILFNAVPSTEGEFRFRDIREKSADVQWDIYNKTEGDAWKTDISSHSVSDSRKDRLGEYEVTRATVFTQSIGHSKRSPPMGPIDDRFISFFLQKKNKPDIYLTLEKVSEAPEVIKKIVDRRHDGGIYAQISDSRDASLRSMNDGYKRQNLDIGAIKWKTKTGSVVTLERFLRYYIQTSAHLAPEYNYYSRNCHHFVEAVVKLLKQLQDIDLSSEVKDEVKDKVQRKGGVSHSIITNVLRLLGTEI